MIDNNKKEKLRSGMLAYMKANNKSQNSLSEIADVGKSTVSNIFNRKWDTISDEMVEKLYPLFVPNEWGVYHTANFTAIQRMCQDAQAYKGRITIPADTGLGKSVALKHYAKTTAGVYYIECSQLMNRKDFLMAVMDAIGFKYQSSLADMVNETAKKVRRIDEDVLLIFDEVDKLSDACLLLLKVLYDKLEGEAGFVTAGTEVLVKRIDAFVRKNRLGYAEIKRRLFNNIKRLNSFDTGKAVIASEIEYMCKDQGVTDQTMIDAILDKATNYGDVKDMIENFQRLQKKAA